MRNRREPSCVIDEMVGNTSRMRSGPPVAESSSDASNIAFAANSVAFDKDNSDWKPSLITVVACKLPDPVVAKDSLRTYHQSRRIGNAPDFSLVSNPANRGITTIPCIAAGKF
ncbi:MAG: hypothetical protein CM15mP49_04490 [Actinomycetota bacterium]|nr:MAG: hypothetical protein CM15mP49_04490 [Actinomycetota bacterium]